MPLPSEIRLDDGFSTIITFANLPMVKLYEKEVTPPQLMMGNAIDTTTMRNTAWRTGAPRKLKTLGAMKATCAFATEVIDDVKAQLGVNQHVILTFPDGATLSFWGWLDDFTPSQFAEGAQPTAVVTVSVSNINASGAEVAPHYSPTSDSSAL